MARGGVWPGIQCGSTNESGATAMENKMHLHDLRATMLHLPGQDHEKLTIRLTDVNGEVKRCIIV